MTHSISIISLPSDQNTLHDILSSLCVVKKLVFIEILDFEKSLNRCPTIVMKAGDCWTIVSTDPVDARFLPRRRIPIRCDIKMVACCWFGHIPSLRNRVAATYLNKIQIKRQNKGRTFFHRTENGKMRKRQQKSANFSYTNAMQTRRGFASRANLFVDIARETREPEHVVRIVCKCIKYERQWR